MKKFLFVLFLSVALGAVNAQTSVYHQFPDSNAIWNITAQGCCWTGCAGPPTPNPIIADSWFSYYIEGDTFINSTSYRKLYKSGSTYEHCAYGNAVNVWNYYDNYVCAFREDTLSRVVYFVSPSAINEMIWFDFSAGVGDTISPWDSCTEVASIDSVLVGSTYRKRFNLTNISSYTIIEGIGSTAGLMEPVCPFEYFGTLTCFSQEGQTLYPDTITSCDLITSLNGPIPTSLQFQINPNPAEDVITLTGLSEISSVKFYNCVGQLVMIADESRIDVSELPGGVYIVAVEHDSEFFRQRLVKR